MFTVINHPDTKIFRHMLTALWTRAYYDCLNEGRSVSYLYP